MARRLLLLLSAVLVVTATCTSGDSDPPMASRELTLRLQLAASLEPFEDCDQVLDYFRTSATDIGPESVVHGIGVVADGMGVAEFDAVTSGAARVDAVAGSAASGGDDMQAQLPPMPGAVEQSDGAGAGTALAPEAGSPFSATNIQEAGVDEPDVVKTDGRVIVAVAQGRLHVIDPSGGGARSLGAVDLPQGSHELFLLGDRAVVLTRSWTEIPVAEGGGDVRVMMIGPGGQSTTVVSAVDISDPAQPAVTESRTFEGDYLTARLHDGIVRMVLRSAPTIQPMPLPVEPGGTPGTEPGGIPGVELDVPDELVELDELGEPGSVPGAELDFRALAAQAVDDSTLEDWLPNEIVEGSDDAPVTEELVPCEAVARPPEPSGVGTVTVLTIDARGSLEPLDTDAVVADAQTVYASTETLYVATNAWGSGDGGEPDVITTELHAFDISAPDRTEYVASGRVRGHLLNQWSLSEHAGHLRVATTDGPAWRMAGDGGPASESFLTVLGRDGDRLAQVGQVGGMGRGEQIYAVRYFGDLGFVVTFRQTDPLYALDLSNPREPRVVGELKIPGFSTYLHPVGTGRLLGVGQDATDEGQRLGTQVSLFDVSDPADPRRIAHSVVADSSSAVEHDHRAFLWWGPTETAVIPIEIWPGSFRVDSEPPIEGELAQPFVGVASFRIGDGSVEPGARVTHAGKAATPSGGTDSGASVQVAPLVPAEEEPGGAGTDDVVVDAVAPDSVYEPLPTIVRALVIGDTLYTLSEAGVMASELGPLTERAWAAF